MSYSLADDSVYSSPTIYTFATDATAVTGTTRATLATKERTETPRIKAKRGWCDPFWSLMLDDDSDKESDETKSRKLKQQQIKKAIADAAKAAEEVSVLKREADPWSFLEDDNDSGEGPIVLRSERAQREYIEYCRWKSQQGKRLSSALNSRREIYDSGRQIYDEGSVDTYLSYPDPFVTCLSSETFASNFTDETEERKPSSSRKGWFGTRRGHERDRGRSRGSRSRSRPRETQEFLGRKEKRDSENEAVFEQKVIRSSKSERRGKNDARELTPRPSKDPKKSKDSKKKKSKATRSKPSKGNPHVGKKENVGRDEEQSQPKPDCPITQDDQPHQDGKPETDAIKEKDIQKDAREEADIGSEKKSSIKAKARRLTNTKPPLPPWSPSKLLPRSHFDIPEVRRAHSFDGVRVTTKPKLTVALRKAASSKKQSISKQDSPSNQTTVEVMPAAQDPPVEQTEEERQPESPNICERDQSGSKAACSSSTKAEREGVSTDSSSTPETPTQIPDLRQSSSQQSRRFVGMSIPRGRGAVFHGTLSSPSTTSHGGPDVEGKRDAQAVRKREPPASPICDRYAVKETISPYGDRHLHDRVNSTSLEADSKPSRFFKGKKPAGKSDLVKRFRTGDSMSVASLDRNNSRLNRRSRRPNTGSVC